MEPSSFKRQEASKQKEINEQLDELVKWAMKHDPHSVQLESTQELSRVRSFLMHEIHQILCKAASLGLRRTRKHGFNNDRFLLQMCQDIISKQIKELYDCERIWRFMTEKEDES